MWKIPLFELDYGDDEKHAVNEVLDSHWLSMGKKVQEFESNFSLYLGGEVQSVALSSCTAALHIALLIAGIMQDDEVIISGLTFVADANVVEMLGARVVLADINSASDLNMSVIDTEKKITKKTKAIILVHFAGFPADTKAFVNLAKKHNLFLIEDVAHAIGAEVENSKCGTYGDISCFSFFSNKNLSTGEGGMLVTKNGEYIKKAKLYRSHGMTSMTIDRHQGRQITYDVIQPGLNYRMDEIHAALGIVQLKKLDDNNRKRKRCYEYYVRRITEKNINILIPFSDSNDTSTSSSYHIFVVVLPMSANRIEVMQKLHQAGIQTSIHYPLIQKFTYYKNLLPLHTHTPRLSIVENQLLTLPLFLGLSYKDIDFIVDNLANVIKE